MKEQFVQYEIAIKLKEKGFDDECMANYEISLTAQENEEDGFSGSFGWEKGEVIFNKGHFVNGLPYCDFSSKKWLMCAAPLWQQVIDWFREKHQIEIVLSGITVYDIRKYHICLYYNVDGIMTDHSMLLFDEETREYAGYQTFTYPEARQTAIEHALTLI